MAFVRMQKIINNHIIMSDTFYDKLEIEIQNLPQTVQLSSCKLQEGQLQILTSDQL